MTTTRNLVAAAVFGLLGGAALASESRIDYTDQQLSKTRAEVVAETRAFYDAHPDFLARSSDAYGYFDGSKSNSEDFGSVFTASRDGITGADIGNEAYGGFPIVDDMMGRGE